jgi:type II secretory pathway predicted ATPase ExeA
MLLKYYKLREQPFGVTPDARYLYESDTHREALASLLYGIEAGRGFIALIAEPGMGKTTLLFRMLGRLRGKAKTVFLFQTISTPLDFLRMLLSELGVQDLKESVFELQAKLNEILLAYSVRGERLAVVVDEAQNLNESVLEFLRMLSNFETPQGKLMEIILSGQPRLARKLASPSLVQLRQRISIIARLRSFSAEDSERYVNHRLRVAGYNADAPLFTPGAMRLVAEHSRGNPRVINNLCFNALSLGCALERKTIDGGIVWQVIADLNLFSFGETRCVAARSKSAQKAPVIAARRPIFSARIQKVAITIVALFSLAGALMFKGSRATVLAKAEQTRNIKQEAASLPTEATPSAETVAPSSDALHFIEHSENLEDRILVPAGATLNQLCAEILKACHSSELREIYRLNPWLTNPNHLEAGRTLRIPSPKWLSAGAHDAPNPFSGKPSTKVASQ